MKLKWLCLLGAAAIVIATGVVMAVPTWRYIAVSHATVVAERLVGHPLSSPPQRIGSPWSQALVESAQSQIGVTVTYDPAYRALSYPNGDIERSKGVCTDVIIRALRDAHDIDLQERVHMDMATGFTRYPNHWGLTQPDRNIDHRRVPNLRRYFEHIGAALPAPTLETEFLPGDIVTWMIAPGRPHIGIVSDRTTRDGARPLIVHNAGLGTRMDDFLPLYPLTGHYRLEGLF